MNLLKRAFVIFLAISACSHLPLALSKPERVAVVNLTGGIDEAQVENVTFQLSLALPKKPEVIVVHIDSGGGNVASGFKIQNMLEAVKVPVVCVVDREASSMAFILLQGSCDRRIMTRRSLLMMHKPKTHFPEGLPEEMKKNFENFNKGLTKATVDDMVVRMRVDSPYVLNKIEKGDWFMGWEEALDIGAIDRVVYRLEDVLKDPLKET